MLLAYQFQTYVVDIMFNPPGFENYTPMVAAENGTSYSHEEHNYLILQSKIETHFN